MLSLPWYIWIPAIFVVAGAAAFVSHTWFSRVSRDQAARMDQNHQAALQERLSALEVRLAIVLQLNRDLVEARDETALVQASLSAVNRLVGGLGSSYVPFDQWGQPLPAFTYGELPEPVIKGWAEHLASQHVRERCVSCSRLSAEPDTACPLQIGPYGGAMSIVCLPLALGERRLGMVNVYLPATRKLDPDLHRFLSGLMDLMALVVESQRLHVQEVTTLRQLNRLRSPRGLSTTLEALLDSLREPLSLDALRLRVRPMSNDRLSNLQITSGDGTIPLFELLEKRWQELAEGDLDCAACYEEGVSWLALPLLLSEGKSLGALVAVRRSGDPFTPSQKGVLETAAAQAALMIENERLNMKLEYTLVIQERTRLAREIHDGLAQMLAFLKMQSAQMQAALTQGDQQRLARLLHDSRQALSDAYNETRHAIDDLRVNSDEGLIAWLSHTAVDFEKTTQIMVKMELAETDPSLLPEIQAHLIRITQEALNNVRKHAQASEVTITLRRLDCAEAGCQEGDWILEIGDNGIGFDPEDVPAETRHGLRGMRERAELIGAEFQITSHLGRGTLVRMFLPAKMGEIEA